jgi:uncharacterized membrane protein
MALSVLFTVEVPLFSSSSPHRQHLLAQNSILIPHVVSGLAAFLIGPFQFSNRLRQRNLRLHRILGKAYVIAIFTSVPSALLLGNALPTPLLIAADSQAILWFICTAAAFVTARNRHIAQHRVWMIRSYSVTLCVWQVFLAHLWQLTLAHLWQFAEQGGMEMRWASG